MKRKELEKFLVDACHILEDSQREDENLIIGGESDAFKLAIDISDIERLAFIVALSSVASLASDSSRITNPLIFAQSIVTVYAMMRNEALRKEDKDVAMSNEIEDDC